MKRLLLSIPTLLLIFTVVSGEEIVQPLNFVIQSKKSVYEWEETIDLAYEVTNVSKQGISLFKLPVSQKIIDSKGNVFPLFDYRNVGYNPQIELKPKESFSGTIALSRIELSKDRTLGLSPLFNQGENQIMLACDFWSSLDSDTPTKLKSNYIVVNVIKKPQK